MSVPSSAPSMVRLPHRNRVVLLLLIVLFAGFLGGLGVWAARSTEERMLVRTARTYASALSSFRSFYSDVILTRLAESRTPVTVAHNYHDIPGAIPIPATMSIELAEYLNDRVGAISTELVSAYPFPWRRGRDLTPFARRALATLEDPGIEEVWDIEYTDSSNEMLSYASPVRMGPACVACHNSHPDTPRVGWKDGDLRGIQLVHVPLTNPILDADDTEMVALIGFVGLGSLGAIGLIALFWRRTDAAYDQLEKTAADLRQATVELGNQKLALDEHAIVSMTDLDGRITYANDKFCAISGYRRDELLGKTHRLVTSGVHPDSFFATMWDTILAGRVWHGEICNKSRDGRIYWVSSTIVPLRDTGGEITSFVSIRTDITQRKKAEEALEREREFLRRLTDAIGEGVYVLDREGRCVFLNPEGERLLGWRPNELSALRLHDVAHAGGPDGEACESGPCSILAMVNRGEVCASDNSVFRRRDGSTFPVSLVSMPLRTEGVVTGSVTVFSDITEAKRREQDLEEARRAAESANHAKSEFLAIMSHEIRTPMNGVLGMVGLLLETPLSQEQRHRALTIRDSAEALLVVINDVLDFSKMEAGRLTLDAEPVDVEALCRGVIDLLSPRARAKGIDLTLDMAPDARGLWRCDGGRLRQILLNLAGNAVKFTDHGRVTIRIDLLPARSSDTPDIPRGLCLSIADTGPGIKEEDLSRLFSRFTQLDGSAARRFGGTGLGLAICKRLTELMGGSIHVESTYGDGSRFWCQLPLAWLGPAADSDSEATGTSAGTAAADIPAPKAGLRVLVAEDNAINQQVAVGYLRGLDCAVDVAADGVEAVAAASAHRYDLILMDMQMPEMDGLEATRRIRAGDGPNRAAPIVAMTANAMDSDRQACLDAGMNAFLTKPVRKKVLIRAITNVLAPPPESPAPVDSLPPSNLTDL